MADNSNIEWTEATWNPVTGCTKISPGCDNCYAERIALRFAGTKAYPNAFDVTLRPERLDMPLKWKRPRRIFVNSMSDLFHKDIPDDFRDKVFDVMEQAHWHTFQVLTKRSSLMMNYTIRRYGHTGKPVPRNIWLGVSLENASQKSRIEHLNKTQAAVLFLSIEPLLGPVGHLDLRNIGWVIVGGESGQGARPMQAEWAREIRDQCVAEKVPFFFKQWGEWAPIAEIGLSGFERHPRYTHEQSEMVRAGKKKAGRALGGFEWNQYPPQHIQMPFEGVK